MLKQPGWLSYNHSKRRTDSIRHGLGPATRDTSLAAAASLSRYRLARVYDLAPATIATDDALVCHVEQAKTITHLAPRSSQYCEIPWQLPLRPT